ncbi:MAG: prolipoprotein diacylglyceryl transferase, partial [Candidatus Latescibacteria bacterium]|nr:prolipoprotein diacylglyceryl transferase [Candidatus Latescibacterota bacterium]
MSPILFEFGPIRIATYGVMLAIGFLCGLWILRRELMHRN